MLVYDTLEQARMRLRGSVITYRDQAVYVRDAYQATKKQGGGLMLSLQVYPMTPETQMNPVEVPINDPDLNFRLFKIGYINDTRTKSTAFLMRHTRRQQTQGIVLANLSGAGQISQRCLNEMAFADMLFGRYPTADQALQMINNDGWTSVGISQYFAMARDEDIRLLRYLMYRGRRVGVALGEKFTEFLVDKNDEYLKEVLQEAGFPFRVE